MLPVAFQGRPGAYSDLACRRALPGRPTLPCDSFEDTIAAVHDGLAEYAMLPCENSLVGRVPDIHTLLPGSGLSIIGEHFQRIEHCLLGIKGATEASLKRVHSHPVALGQVRRLIRELGVQAIVGGDTAGAAQLVSEWARPADGAIASDLAAEIYGLVILRRNVEDASHNTTRFYIASRQAQTPSPDTPDLMTTFIFSVRNIPAALYKALGGFATNGVNLTKLESYMVGGAFRATEFMCDVEGHPDTPALSRALDELNYFSDSVRILGTYAKSPLRV